MDPVIIFIFTEVMTCNKVPGVLIEAEIIWKIQNKKNA